MSNGGRCVRAAVTLAPCMASSQSGMNCFDVVEAQYYGADNGQIDPEHVLHIYVAESITTDCRMFQPHRPLSTYGAEMSCNQFSFILLYTVYTQDQFYGWL